jgi:ferric-dicitrate binding protein FerR (iron transport regulator)
MNDRLWELLAKYWTQRITSEEKTEMERMLLAHPDHWLRTGLMQQINWKLDPALSTRQADRIADRILGSVARKDADIAKEGGGKDPLRKILRHWKKAAAVLLVLMMGASLAYVWHGGHSGDHLRWQQVTTTNGMKTTLRLADGTKLWVNAGSTLRYPENFNEKTREVYLSGEAYFRVKHDPGRPFIIHTSDMDVKVLGTEFDVRAYSDEDYSETSLIKGAVEVSVNRDKQPQQIYLKPKQKIVVAKTSIEIKQIGDKNNGTAVTPSATIPDSFTRNIKLEPIKVLRGNIIAETAWKENTLLFEDESLQSLARRMERWYGVKIIIRDPALAGQRFTGSGDNVSLDKLLRILQMIKPFHYLIHDQQVIISR